MNTKWSAIIATLFITSFILLTISSSNSTQAKMQMDQTSTPEPAGTGINGNKSLNHPLNIPAQTNSFPENMTEGFEGAWPNSGWGLSDQTNDDGGIYFLGDRQGSINCPVHGGSWYGWMVGGGPNGSQLNCSQSTYPSNADTWAFYGPFSLSNANASSLTFFLRGHGEAGIDPQTNLPYDYLFVGASANGSDFCGRFIAQGAQNDPGFVRFTLNLATLSCSNNPPLLGQNQVWIGFNFTSDISNEDIGYFLDDIQLSTTLNPTITPTRTPTNTRTPTSTRTPTITATFTPSTTSTNTSTTEPSSPTHTPTDQVRIDPTDTPKPPIEQRNFLPIILKDLPTPIPIATNTPPPSPTPIPQDCGDIEPNSIRSQAKPLLVTGAFCSGTLDGETDGGDDYYYLQLNQGDTIKVTLKGVPIGANFDIFLFDPTGKRILDAESINPDQSDEFFSYTIPKTGRYIVDVFGRTVSTVAPNTYSLQVQVN